MARIRRALLSVYDKTGLADLARTLAGHGVELISSGGTARALREAGLVVRDVSEVTGFPELMDGRVKTLHPKIHGALLGRRDDPAHAAQAKQHGIEWIDLVVVNLYPFERTVAKPDVTLDDALENIDIGGPAMLRAAAKNFPHVTVVSSPEDYELLQGADVDDSTRRTLAQRTFARTSAYDAAIAAWLGGETRLRYGENPHQQATLTATADRVNSLARAVQHGEGKELSYNNYLDLDAAMGLALDLEGPAAVIVKHQNPCGAAEAETPADAFARALSGDPVSAFGGVIAVNRPVDAAVVKLIARKENFFEAIVAPGYADVETLRRGTAWGKNLRILEVKMDRSAPRPRRVRSIAGGLLSQSDDAILYERFETVTVPPSDAQRRDLLFAWTACKHVKSNAIVLATDRTLVGLGAGQVSRVDAAHLAVRKAGDRARGSVAASDAFFPFPDGVEALIAGGVSAIVQPGGSRRDDEVIAAARERKIPMILTGTRHFRH